MANHPQELAIRNSNILGLFVGMLVGALAGAVTTLLLAPQSGAATRSQIQEKSIELRDRTGGMVEDAMAQVRMDRKEFVMNGRHKAEDLLHHGQDLVVEQLEHVSEAALAGKRAIQNN